MLFLDTRCSFQPNLFGNMSLSFTRSECMSGDPEALYYRILQRREDKGNKIELCIQHLRYWQYQHCMMTSHGYDYEPIFIYLKKSDDLNPQLIINGGLGGPDCSFL